MRNWREKFLKQVQREVKAGKTPATHRKAVNGAGAALH